MRIIYRFTFAVVNIYKKIQDENLGILNETRNLRTILLIIKKKNVCANYMENIVFSLYGPTSNVLEFWYSCNSEMTTLKLVIIKAPNR